MACLDIDAAPRQGLALADAIRVQPQDSSAPGPLFEPQPATLACLAAAGELDERLHHLREGCPSHLQCAAAEARAIHATSFFRDQAAFDALRQSVLPRILASRRRDRRLRFWSAACSTGQEAYSLAMLLLDGFPEVADWDICIIASDVSQAAVDHARMGRFQAQQLAQGLAPHALNHHFQPLPDGSWQAGGRLRELCDFQLIDLCKPLPRLPVFDLVLLRNALLYIPQQERGNLFAELHRSMAHDGFLLLGSAEQAEDSTKLFEVEPHANCCFYRPASRSGNPYP